MNAIRDRVAAAQEDDLPEIARQQSSYFSNPWGLSRLQKDLEDERFIVRVLHVDAAFVGHYLARCVVDELELLSLVVCDEHRRRGFGLRLMTDLFAVARDREVTAVFLEVRNGNTEARQLYQKHGFHQVGKREAYYSDGEDAILMRYIVEPASGVRPI